MLFFRNSCKLFRFSDSMLNRNFRASNSLYILLCLIAGLAYLDTANSQTIVFLETFGNTGIGVCDQNTEADSFTTPNGMWRVTTLGINDTAANKWYISATEPGMAVGGCATSGCQVNPVYTDRTLHIGNVPNSPNAATICPTGDCGAVYDAGGSQTAVQTNDRAESPPFSLQANTAYMLLYNYLEYADGAINADNALVEFFNGVAWVPAIHDSPRTQNPCGTSSYQWGQDYVLLPVLSAPVANAQIGFTWTNDNGGQGTSPSFAVDSIRIIQLPPPVANITVSDTDLCTTDCINFSADSVGPVASYTWQFNGANPPTSSARNPSGVCYPAVGTYTATVTVTTLAGSDVDTVTIVVNPCFAPVADFVASDSNFCERSCITFTDMTTNGPTQWMWSFPGGVPSSSTSPSPPPVCYQTPGSYNVTLTVFNQYGSDTLTKTAYLVVDTCPFPIADFNNVITQLCPEECATFTDNSQFGPILSYDWFFPGGTPDTSTAAAPTVCYDQDGQYDVQLIVTNQYGSDTVYKYSQVSVSFLPNAFVGPDTSMRFGESYHMSSGGGLHYQWSPSTGLDNDTIPDPVASPKQSTVYTVAISDANGCTAIRQVRITIIQDNNIFVPNSFSPNGDGSNEKLFVRGNNLYGVRLTVFDRWGEKVFETTDQSQGWDGTYNGKELDPGVFTYVVTVNYNNKESATQSGTVTLIR
jgi:gliding motility-associated-like protein